MPNRSATEDGARECDNLAFLQLLSFLRPGETSLESEVTRLRTGRKNELGHVHSRQSLSHP